MKKAIIASIIGAAATVGMVNSVHAQGQVVFCNYAQGGALTAPVTYSGVAMSGLVDGEAIGYTTGASDPTFHASVLYSINGGAYADAGVVASFITPNGTDPGSGGGLFGGTANAITIPGYTSGTVNFIVEVYNGSDFSTSTIRGESAVVTLTSLATAANLQQVGSLLSDNSFASTPLQAFTVSAVPVPEPTTLALAGLGGFGMLMALRRKKA